MRVLTLYAIDDVLAYASQPCAPFGPGSTRYRSPSRREIPNAGLASRPSGDDPARIPERHPSPGAVGPASRLRRRYADAPAAALLTGLGAGEWARSLLPVAAAPPIRPYSLRWG